MGHIVEERIRSSAVYPYIGDIQAIMVMPDGTLEGSGDSQEPEKQA